MIQLQKIDLQFFVKNENMFVKNESDLLTTQQDKYKSYSKANSSS